jgi:hypothetical protein
MKSVSDIDLNGFNVRGWRCSCGNEHSRPEDVDKIVKFLRYIKTNREVKIFKSGNSLAIRIPKQIVDLYNLSQDSKLLINSKDKKIILEIPKT